MDSVKTPEMSPFVQFPSQSSTPLNQPEVLMGGNFTNPSQFIPQQYPINPANDTPLYDQSSNPANSANAISALTSQQSYTNNQEALLQAIMNSPGQLQRLISILNLQNQQNVPAPPPLDLNSTAPVQEPSTYYNTTQPPSQMQPPITSHVASSSSLANAMGPDANTLSLLQPDESVTVPFDFGPLMSNDAQFQKTYKDATDISAEVDAMQANLDSLIQNLGLDPSQIASIREAGAVADSEPIFTSADDNLTPIATPDSTSTDATAPESDPPVTTMHTDNGMKMDNNTQFTGNIPDFDINAFINEFNRQQQEQQQHGPQQGAADHNMTDAGLGDFSDFLINDHGQQNTSPHLSAYVDEVASQSDASSPSVRRASFEDPIVVPVGSNSANASSMTSRGMGPSDKKTRKRKSDLDFAVGNGNEQSIGSTKPKRKR